MLRGIVFLSAVLFLGIVVLAGCGGVSVRGGLMPTPTPAPTPSPMPTPGGSAGPDSFLAQIFVSVGKTPTSQGHITIDTAANSGMGSVQLNAAGANNSLILQFCPFPQSFNNCMNITSFTTDANGNANMSFMFPQKGTFSGLFQLVGMSGVQFAASGSGGTGMNFQSALLPAATITGGIAQPTGSAPGSGAAMVTNTMAHITLNGSMPNHTFSTALCGLFPQTPCTPMAGVTTDMNGNASMDVGMLAPGSDGIFVVSDSAGAQYVTAFRVM